jgi:tetratricopeptide (TPR) repeat protein
VSFTHFQNAFQEWADRAGEIEFAFAAARRALLADDRDPAAHWAMGRALWLRGALDESLHALERAIDLSPNFVLGHYTLGFLHSQSGDPDRAIAATAYAGKLSPFDPMLFAMFATRALAHARRGELDAAAHWAVKAAGRPNAHAQILAIATHCLAAAGRLDEARAFAGALRRQRPGYDVENFLATFRFAPDAVALFRGGARRIGLG